jgi:truncated hemoglobin YjbI
VSPAIPAKLYDVVGGAAGCQALAKAFYAQVERDPVLRPLFPSTFKCAIEQFSAFLVQFLGGEADATQARWYLSLRESHARFSIGARERDAWLGAMTATLSNEALIADSGVRSELLAFFTHSSVHVVNQGKIPAPAKPLCGEAATLWDEQVALDEAIALARSAENAARCIEMLQGDLLQARFARSPAVHASVLALAAKSKSPLLRDYCVAQIGAHPALIFERYSHQRTLLHDACAAGDVDLVRQLLDMGAEKVVDNDSARSPLYCVGNECSAPGASRIVRLLLRQRPELVNAVYGPKRCTALHMAARRGNTDVITALLDEGADIEARDSAGETPLRRAVNCNKVEAARVLLARGADPHSTGSKALTPASAARANEMKRIFADRRAVK